MLLGLTQNVHSFSFSSVHSFSFVWQLPSFSYTHWLTSHKHHLFLIPFTHFGLNFNLHSLIGTADINNNIDVYQKIWHNYATQTNRGLKHYPNDEFIAHRQHAVTTLQMSKDLCERKIKKTRFRLQLIYKRLMTYEPELFLKNRRNLKPKNVTTH